MHSQLSGKKHQICRRTRKYHCGRMHFVRALLCGLPAGRKADSGRRAACKGAHRLRPARCGQRCAFVHCRISPDGFWGNEGGALCAGLFRRRGNGCRRHRCKTRIRAHDRLGRARCDHLVVLSQHKYADPEILPLRAAVPCRRTLADAGALPPDQTGRPKRRRRIHRAVHLQKGRSRAVRRMRCRAYL